MVHFLLLLIICLSGQSADQDIESMDKLVAARLTCFFAPKYYGCATNCMFQDLLRVQLMDEMKTLKKTLLESGLREDDQVIFSYVKPSRHCGGKLCISREGISNRVEISLKEPLDDYMIEEEIKQLIRTNLRTDSLSTNALLLLIYNKIGSINLHAACLPLKVHNSSKGYLLSSIFQAFQ